MVFLFVRLFTPQASAERLSVKCWRTTFPNRMDRALSETLKGHTRLRFAKAIQSVLPLSEANETKLRKLPSSGCGLSFSGRSIYLHYVMTLAICANSTN